LAWAFTAAWATSPPVRGAGSPAGEGGAPGGAPDLAVLVGEAAVDPRPQQRRRRRRRQGGAQRDPRLALGGDVVAAGGAVVQVQLELAALGRVELLVDVDHRERVDRVAQRAHLPSLAFAARYLSRSIAAATGPGAASRT
jgi:hypothetical protein